MGVNARWFYGERPHIFKENFEITDNRQSGNEMYYKNYEKLKHNITKISYNLKCIQFCDAEVVTFHNDILKVQTVSKRQEGSAILTATFNLVT